MLKLCSVRDFLGWRKGKYALTFPQSIWGLASLGPHTTLPQCSLTAPQMRQAGSLSAVWDGNQGTVVKFADSSFFQPLQE